MMKDALDEAEADAKHERDMRVAEAHKAQALITAAVLAEREACAKIADEKRDDGLNADLLSEPVLWVDGYEHGCKDVAAAIRARGDKP